ncbi:hypothetical protein K435DRAFT_694872 [Dendrothele bispora CBS 962.96]|uniref:Uncharacterized protein n=1 Tax=Dendrothele bispora (strain CBS 962.96) TaxID=1314807 RepID=A0A4S8KY59_DENBC|nr:hypothetical protein K435DRAFT_694872 [Dendrothele bispora CBS 962.96]
MFLLYALARPLPSLLASTNESLPSPEASLEAQNSCFDIRSCRTAEEVLYSCLAVVFACTWVAIHPNIPRHFELDTDDPDEIKDSFTISSARVIAQDVITMILSLLAPELIILWALRQWFAAREIAEKYRDYGWTKTHGHFLIMGGFALLKDVEFLIQHKYIDITEDEITARGKTDFLTKFIAVVQTNWFILQCIARVTEGLVVTDLETVTVAFALLNIATYVLWWNKPQRVRYPVKIDYCRRHVRSEITVKENRSAWKSFTSWVKRGVEAMLLLTSKLRDWLLQRKTRSAWKSFTSCIEEIWDAISDADIDDVLSNIPLALSIVDLSGGQGSYQTGLEDDPLSLYPTVIFLFLVFGGIHCAPWNSTFPTHTEQILWRISAVTVTAFPSVWFPLFGVIQFLDEHHTWRNAIELIYGAIVIIVGFLLPLAYIWARITLIVIAFTELRALPPSAYQTVDWARFIPHI